MPPLTVPSPPFGPTWDYVSGPSPWHSKSQSSVASRERLLQQKGELLSARVTILQVLRFAADFSREHGGSSTNLANFLSDGIFLSDDVPFDLDDLERCLHKLAFALAMHDPLTIVHLNRLCTEASSSSSQGTSSVRRFGTLLCNLHIATYCALVYREAAGTDAPFRDWNNLDDDERLFLDLGAASAPPRGSPKAYLSLNQQLTCDACMLHAAWCLSSQVRMHPVPSPM